MAFIVSRTLLKNACMKASDICGVILESTQMPLSGERELLVTASEYRLCTGRTKTQWDKKPCRLAWTTRSWGKGCRGHGFKGFRVRSLAKKLGVDKEQFGVNGFLGNIADDSLQGLEDLGSRFGY